MSIDMSSLSRLVYGADRVEEITDPYILRHLKAGESIWHRPPQVYDPKVWARPLSEWDTMPSVINEIHNVVMLPHTVIECKLLRWYMAINESADVIDQTAHMYGSIVPFRTARCDLAWAWRTGLHVGYCEKCRLLQWAHGEPQIRPVFPPYCYPSQDQFTYVMNKGHADLLHEMYKYI